jgi:poly-beta-hydroxybutyrate-responsive repressor
VPLLWGWFKVLLISFETYILYRYMSRKAMKNPKITSRPGSKKPERYLQPSILMSLRQKPSYGYQLIQNISQFGFIEGKAPPGMIYRHLRELEENGLVLSEWQTEETGPAKRIYQLTAEGSEVLDYWIAYMRNQADNLLNFIKLYENI